MSFWPFSNSYSNSNHLSKFLDSVLDFSNVTVDNILDDKTLQQDFMDELKRLASKSSDKDSFHLVQSLQSDNSSAKSNASNANSDSISVSSNSESTGGNSFSKNAREAKILELIMQPHILDGFMDYIVESVEFYHDLAIQEEKEQSEHAKGEYKPTDESNEDIGSNSHGNDNESKQDRLRRCIQCSADVLSVDMWVISNQIIESPSLMNKLWSIISLPHFVERSPSVAYFVQILDHLMESNTIKLLNFIRKQSNLVDTFLGKVEIPILMDFFLKVIQTDKLDSPTGILEVLHQQNMIPKLINILKPDLAHFDKSLNYIPDADQLFRQTAATELAKALVTISSNASLAVDMDTNIGPNPLTRELASSEMIRIMIEEIILFRIPDEENPSITYTNKHGISNCVSILIELIRKNNSDYDVSYGQNQPGAMADNTGEVNVQSMFNWLKDFESNPPGPRDPVYLGDLLEVFSENLDKLSELIDADVSEEVVNPNYLGMSKFKISELVAELLHCSNMILINSRKIAFINHTRDQVRDLQNESIQNALNETLLTDEKNSNETLSDSQELADVTMGMDDVSLKEVHQKKPQKLSSIESNFNDAKYRRIIEELEYSESDDDEPIVSSENPFVCDERDETFRKNPCAGDKFKIALIDSGILRKIITRFKDFEWHNFFHNVVFDLVQQIFNGKLNSYNSFLIVELFRKDRCDIINMISSSFAKEVDPRPGYMGHLILISEEVVKFTSLYKPALISPVLVECIGSKEWEWFVNNVLLKTRELYNVILGADAEYTEDEQHNHNGDRTDEDAFGFDSSTVGYMDLENEAYNNGDNGDDGKKNVIILGDASNHDEFVRRNPSKEDRLGTEFDEDEHDTKLSNVEIQKMSPKLNFENNDDMIYDDFESNNSGFPDNELQDNEFLENLSGSSSSDEEEDGNQLRRIPKHKG
ncbi:SIT4 phosphatase-associated family protein [Clavispora lusitaniae]|uniref:SIT4 phosphatase-associated family protein n=1 Tax=Clavispora lusitaniae TaxID=36911 RepID=UPI00202C8BC6|nr:SIT4 phosphatase-associated family protein [Clavispora lusitaniae]